MPFFPEDGYWELEYQQAFPFYSRHIFAWIAKINIVLSNNQLQVMLSDTFT